MNSEIYEWLLLLLRWLHITVGITWIGTSIFFMWLDRSFVVNPESKNPGHIGDLWMVHGGGFYHVEKLQMGLTPVPRELHWFKWESYWTWMSGITLLALIFYSGSGTFLLDSTISKISFPEALGLSLGSILISWFFYDFLWESEVSRKMPALAHAITLFWFGGMVYLLCHTLSGRAAYIHIGGMLGTWMTANVFLRIIPRQVKMVEAAKLGQPVNPVWSQNAKNRSTHNTYFTLPVIFIMLSNHFPNTYGNAHNWQILILLSAAGAALREFFVSRLKNPRRSKLFGTVGAVLILGLMAFTRENTVTPTVTRNEPTHAQTPSRSQPPILREGSIQGVVTYSGTAPTPEKLALPAVCNPSHKGEVFSNDILIDQGQIQNVLIRITRGLEGKTFTDIPATPVVLDQRECQYEPRLIAVRVGQKVEFLNSDPTFHNVKSVSKNNENFNVAMPSQNDRIEKVFTRPEILIESKCSVHPWMSASIAVMDHPYYAVTQKDGSYALPPLSPGTYTLEAWHEVFGSLTKTLTINAGESPKIDFEYGSKEAR